MKIPTWEYMEVFRETRNDEWKTGEFNELARVVDSVVPYSSWSWNELGAIGWELVSVKDGGHQEMSYAWFKRQMSEVENDPMIRSIEEKNKKDIS